MGGFGLDLPVAQQNIQLSESGTLPFLYILPSMRGQFLTLVVNNMTYTSPVSKGKRNDAFDGAADDGITALNAVGMLFKLADMEKVMVRGGSRGATVALLMGKRDTRIKG